MDWSLMQRKRAEKIRVAKAELEAEEAAGRREGQGAGRGR